MSPAFSEKVVLLQAQRKCQNLLYNFALFSFRNSIKPRSNGGANAIDFYSGLKLDGPLNKDMKTYV